MASYFKERVVAIAGASVWECLPEDLQGVPHQVTAKTGIQVEILPLEACTTPLFGLEKATAVLDIDGDAQRIVVWCDPEQITSSILAHELIHLRRDILESKPKMMPFRCSPSESGLIHLVENELEHLLIIPEEMKRFADAEDRWAEHYNRLVDIIIEREEPDLLELIFTWMQLRSSLPNQVDIAKRLAAHLRSLGADWGRTCDHIRFNAMESIPDKAKLIALITTEISSMSSRMGQSVAIGHWDMSEGQLAFSIKMVGGKRLNQN